MSYWRCFYHCVWTTKRRQPLLTPEVESAVYKLLRNKAASLGGIVHALNGTTDHVHLVVSIPPKIAVATFIGQVKGVASSRFNKEHPQATPFYWQREYGVFSFDQKRLPPIVDYVRRQKEHHRTQNTISPLERTTDDDQMILREEQPPYLATPGAVESDEDNWWSAVLALYKMSNTQPHLSQTGGPLRRAPRRGGTTGDVTQGGGEDGIGS